MSHFPKVHNSEMVYNSNGKALFDETSLFKYKTHTVWPTQCQG